MEQLRNNIKVTDLIAIDTLSATTSGSAIDTYGSAEEKFDSALIRVAVGSITGTPDSVKVKIEEDDDSSFSSPSVISGGEEITVAGDTAYTLQVVRSKRYIRAVVTITGGTTPTVEMYVVGVLNNWSTPYPLL